MRRLLYSILMIIIGSSLAFGWASEEEIDPTPHEEYENPTAEYITQKIAGILIQDIQIKFTVKSTRGKDFIIDYYGDTETSLPKGMYKIVGDGKIPITKWEAEDALKKITYYYIYDAIENSDKKIQYIATMNGLEKGKKPTKKMIEEFDKEYQEYKTFYQWFRYYFELLSSGDITPDQVLPLEEWKKKVEAGEIEVDE